MRKLFFAFIVFLSSVLSPLVASAAPALQLYVEGSIFDTASETWVLNWDGSSAIRVWAIGNVGGFGTIYDAKLSIAFATSEAGSLGFTFTPGVTGGVNGFVDPSTPIAPTSDLTGGDGTKPDELSWHGVFGPGTSWQSFKIGDFSLQDSQIADFQNTVPTVLGSDPTTGQINVYDVTVTGATADTWLHFDLYDHVLQGNKHTRVRTVFAPYSHDGGVTNDGAIPEPASLLSFGTLIGLAALRFRRKK